MAVGTAPPLEDNDEELLLFDVVLALGDVVVESVEVESLLELPEVVEIDVDVFVAVAALPEMKY
jgi:hypothetical protein